ADPSQQRKMRFVCDVGGPLGSAYDPFRLRYEPGVGVRLPDAQLPESVTASRLEARWDLLHHLDGGLTPAAGPAGRLDRHYELAHTLIASRQSLAALDVERGRAASITASATPRWSPAAGSREAGRSAPPTSAASGRSTATSARPTWEPRSSPGSASAPPI